MFRWPVLLGLVVAAFVLLSVTELGVLAFLLLIVLPLTFAFGTLPAAGLLLLGLLCSLAVVAARRRLS